MQPINGVSKDWGDDIHVAGILGPGGVPEKYKQDQDQEPDQEKLGKKINVKPGNTYEVFFRVENPDDFTKQEIKDRAKKAFKQIEAGYKLELKSVKYKPKETKVIIRFLALETSGQNKPAGAETSGQYQTASFFVGFTVAAAAFLIIDLLSEIRMTFIGARKVKPAEESGGVLSIISNTLGKAGAALILGGIAWAVLQWNENTG